ncbi:hypothetical protein TcasGA2_TC002233 [Tribolium castaneum]|uniref:Uncharacterized protein n=1 Tax=Tribolium castaneum TaxID=7070 RepID=D7GYD4_TRICA|nr:hypothetical protein TcasGA2_TC002233 [Tribolium castaneum]
MATTTIMGLCPISWKMWPMPSTTTDIIIINNQCQYQHMVS